MSDNDLIRRIDAIQACQVGPSDEWSKFTKDGYNQAATDCSMNILRIAPAVLAELPEVRALVAAALQRAADLDPAIFDHPSVYMGGPSQDARRKAKYASDRILALIDTDHAAALRGVKAASWNAALDAAAGSVGALEQACVDDSVRAWAKDRSEVILAMKVTP